MPKESQKERKELRKEQRETKPIDRKEEGTTKVPFHNPAKTNTQRGKIQK